MHGIDAMTRRRRFIRRKPRLHLQQKVKARRNQDGGVTVPSYMGVRYHEGKGLYLAFVRTGPGSAHHYTDIGWFDSAIDAAKAHDAQKLIRLGPTARLNFPVAIPQEEPTPPKNCRWVRQLEIGQRVYRLRRVKVPDSDGVNTWVTEYFTR